MALYFKKVYLVATIMALFIACSSESGDAISAKAPGEKRMTNLSATAEPKASVQQMLGQKLMLDLRYYCQQPPADGQCRTPLTTLPPALADVISRYDIGGVILFSENLQDVQQIVQLTHDLQQAAANSRLQQPLFIGIDQEGGRVARLPRSLATSFAGNMAIGASYKQHGTAFATKVGQVLSDELLALGINVNFAPTVDVNVNRDNPVINVRSFGESADMVAELGGAMTAAMQSRGMIAALKHFPGHGDTHVDSHFGLPRVDHDAAQIRRIDLHPFAQIIKQHAPGMLMTAHIQYPALDSSTFTAADGSQMIKPATLSHKILHDILRDELNYQGVVVTDALDMAGISHFFSPTEAVIQTFAAGADIALMPVKIQHPGQLTALSHLLNALEQAVQSGQLKQQQLNASYSRIIKLKQQYNLVPAAKPKKTTDKLTAWAPLSLVPQVARAQALLGNAQHRQIELALAQAAITQVKPHTGDWPFSVADYRRVAIIMPDNSKALALASALQHYSKTPLEISTISLQQADMRQAEKQIANAQLVISGFISPMQSLAEIGGMDDMSGIANVAAAYQRQKQHFAALLPVIAAHKRPHIYISLRAPYDLSQYSGTADIALASYAYNTGDDPAALDAGNAVYQALAQVLLGLQQPQGALPVSLEAPAPGASGN